MKKKYSICFFIILINSYSCLSVRNKKKSDAALNIPKNEVHSRLAYSLFSPEKAKAIMSEIEIESKIFGEGFKVPAFAFQSNGSDFVKVLRCQERVRKYLEESYNQVINKSWEEKKWIWIEASGNPKMCHLVSERFNGDEFHDIGAPNGHFFYIINACVSASLSSTKNEECGHNLSFSQSINYLDSPIKEFRLRSQKLAEAESAYDATISQLLGLSRDTMNQKESCEFEITHEESRRNAQTFGWDLMSGAIAIGTALSARAFLSAKLNPSFDNFLKNVNKTGSFLRKLGAVSEHNKSLFVNGVIFSAYAISLIIRQLQSERGKGFISPACQQADDFAQMIITISESGILQEQMNEMIKITEELELLDKTFKGYQENLL